MIQQPKLIVPRAQRIRTTFQFAADLAPHSEAQGDLVWRGVVETVLSWAQSRFSERFPPEASGLRSFDLELPGQEVRCVAIDDRSWSLRLTHPDAPLPGRLPVPGRTWRTELALARTEAGGMRFAARVICASMEYATQPIAFTRPRIVNDLADRYGLEDVRSLTGTAWELDSDSDLVEFRDFLLDHRRTLPVYLVSSVSASGKDYELVDAADLAIRARGLAHVATIGTRLSYEWTALVGKVWSAYNGAVRTYLPALSFDDDDPREHRLALGGTILDFSFQNQVGEDAFVTFLIEQAHVRSATARFDPSPCLFFADAIRRQSTIALEAADQDADWRSLYEETIGTLNRKLEELAAEAEEYNDDAIAAGRERDQYAEDNWRLKRHNDALRAALAAIGRTADESVPAPEGYDDLPEWVSTHLPGRLTLHPRATKELKDALYEDLEHVVDSILLLANEYRNMRLGLEGAKEAFEAGLERLTLRNGFSISEEKAGEQGMTYFVPYPPRSGRTQFLRFHLRTKANTRDPRRCLAIYFFWDDDRKEVVVGSLPGHLDNRLT